MYYAGHCRSAEQLAEVQQLEAAGLCRFCSPQLETQPVTYRNPWWTVTPNRWPYPGAALHLLLVPHRHVRDLLDLPAPAWLDLRSALLWARHLHTLAFYGLAARCGPCAFTGGTVEHVHVHLLVGDVLDPAHKPVRVKLSSRPP